MQRHWRQRQWDGSGPYYNSDLLNELHNNFPELLYNIDRFTTVRSVLEYIQEQAEETHNVFLAARRQWQAQRQPQQQGRGAAFRAAAERAHVPGYVRRRADTTRLPTVNTPLSAPNPLLTSFFTTAAPNPTITTYSSPFLVPSTFIPSAAPVVESPTQAEIDSASALLTLLGLMTPATPPLTQLFAPVIVRPSAETIQQATEQRTISEPPPPDGVCVICQEEFEIGATVRTIRHCQHVFHGDCIMRHFETSVRCPTCRHDIRNGAVAAAALPEDLFGEQ